MSITTGNYKVTYYNERGTKNREIVHVRSGLQDAIARGRKTVANIDKLHSFSVDRRIYNSMDVSNDNS